MAVSGMLRRSISPSVVPLALRAIGSSTTLNRPISAARHPDDPLNQSRNFSSVAADKDSFDANFYGFLKQEMKSAKSKLKTSEVTPPDSFPFEIQVTNLCRRLELKRKFHDDEDVTITIHMSNVNTEEIDYDYDTTSDDDSPQDAISVEDNNAPAIPMSIEVSKAGGDKTLDFNITISTNGISIDKYLISNDEKDYSIWRIEGPKLEVEKRASHRELRDYICKYLEIRGIKTNMATFLLRYIAKKNKEIDLLALKQLKKLIKK